MGGSFHQAANPNAALPALRKPQVGDQIGGAARLNRAGQAVLKGLAGREGDGKLPCQKRLALAVDQGGDTASVEAELVGELEPAVLLQADAGEVAFHGLNQRIHRGAVGHGAADGQHEHQQQAEERRHEQRDPGRQLEFHRGTLHDDASCCSRSTQPTPRMVCSSLTSWPASSFLRSRLM